MQLSFYADYSCRVLMYLAVRPEGKSSIEEVAKAYGISTNHLVKVVHNLAKLGFLATTRGRGGGISLAKAPQSIKIGDVIRKTEPSLDIVECFNASENTCPIAPACVLKRALFEAREAFMKVLDSYTLQDICRSPSTLQRLLEKHAKDI